MLSALRSIGALTTAHGEIIHLTSGLDSVSVQIGLKFDLPQVEALPPTRP